METKALFNKIADYIDERDDDIDDCIDCSKYFNGIKFVSEASLKLFIGKMRSFDNDVLKMLKLIPDDEFAELVKYKNDAGTDLETILTQFYHLEICSAYLTERKRFLDSKTTSTTAAPRKRK